MRRCRRGLTGRCGRATGERRGHARRRNGVDRRGLAGARGRSHQGGEALPSRRSRHGLVRGTSLRRRLDHDVAGHRVDRAYRADCTRCGDGSRGGPDRRSLWRARRLLRWGRERAEGGPDLTTRLGSCGDPCDRSDRAGRDRSRRGLGLRCRSRRRRPSGGRLRRRGPRRRCPRRGDCRCLAANDACASDGCCGGLAGDLVRCEANVSRGGAHDGPGATDLDSARQRPDRGGVRPGAMLDGTGHDLTIGTNRPEVRRGPRRKCRAAGLASQATPEGALCGLSGVVNLRREPCCQPLRRRRDELGRDRHPSAIAGSATARNPLGPGLPQGGTLGRCPLHGRPLRNLGAVYGARDRGRPLWDRLERGAHRRRPAEHRRPPARHRPSDHLRRHGGAHGRRGQLDLKLRRQRDAACPPRGSGASVPAATGRRLLGGIFLDIKRRLEVHEARRRTSKPHRGAAPSALTPLKEALSSERRACELRRDPLEQTSALRPSPARRWSRAAVLGDRPPASGDRERVTHAEAIVEGGRGS